MGEYPEKLGFVSPIPVRVLIDEAGAGEDGKWVCDRPLAGRLCSKLGCVRRHHLLVRVQNGSDERGQSGTSHQESGRYGCV